MTCMDDWPTTVRKAELVLDERFPKARAFSLGGLNFMTPEVLGFYRTPAGRVVEVSTGWFVNERLFGVTVGGDERRNLSRCVYSLEAVAAYMEEI